MRPHEPVTRAFFATKRSLAQGAEPSAGLRARSVFTGLALVLAAALCFKNWLEHFSAMHALYLEIPFADYWRVVYHLPQIQRFDFRYLWQQHNEHRIVFPDLVFAFDVLVFRMRRVLPVVVSCLCYVSSWLVLACPILRDRKLAPADRVLIVLVASAAIGWKGSALSLGDPFLLQWSLMSLAALLSLLLLGPQSNAYVAGAIACGVVATYSCGNGLLLWPVLWTAAALFRLNRRQMVALLLSGCIAIALYFVGYRFVGDSSFTNLLYHPFYTAGFVATFLSMPFGGMKSPHFGLYVGGAAVSVFLLLAPAAIRSRNRLGIVSCGWYTFTLISAVLIAAGRMDPSDTTFTAARASRYLVPVMLSWGALLILVLYAAAQRRFAWMPLLPLIVMALLMLSSRKLNWWWSFNLRPFVAAQITQLSLENDVFDPELIRHIFPSPEFVAHYLPELKDSRLSIYAEPSSLGEMAKSRNMRAAEIERTLPVASGLEVIGRSPVRATRVLLVNPAGTIIGLGRALPFGLPDELMPPHTARSEAWIAFVPERYRGQAFLAFVP